MIITDKKELARYSAPYRIWQGIAGIEITSNGRIFCSFYSGGTEEDYKESFCLLVRSSDGGMTFEDPVTVIYDKGYRCFDPCIWIDPIGRLWLFWTHAPDQSVYAAVCDDPCANDLVWSSERKIADGLMLNKPTVLSTGEWLLPVAIFRKGFFVCDTDYEKNLSCVYRSSDNGDTFEKIGQADFGPQSFNEHMILELNDATLAMYARTSYGVGISYSYDRGRNWLNGVDSRIPGPCSRFHIRRLPSGRILMINHHDFTGRNNLTALLSEDEGKTWKYKLLLDERGCSYPDVSLSGDGYIYISYDHGRGAYMHSLDELYSLTREILYAKITEEDIIAGKILSGESSLKNRVVKLGRYIYESDNPYDETVRYSEDELVCKLMGMSHDNIKQVLFDYYGVNCINMHKLDRDKLDSLMNDLDQDDTEKGKTVLELVQLVRSVSDDAVKDIPVVERVKAEILSNFKEDVSVKDLAEKIGISYYYMMHIFKKKTGITVNEYKNSLKIIRAKELLINTDMKIADIAYECGFGSESYFSKMFSESEGLSPAQYRKILKR